MIRRFLAQEGAKLREMNFTEKRQYIWEYYKLQIFITVFCLFFIGSLINHYFINPPKREYLYITWAGDLIYTGPLDRLAERLNVIVENPDRYRVSVRSYALTGEPQMDQALITRFHALISVGDIDALLVTKEGVVAYAEFGVLSPVHDVMNVLAEIDPGLHRDMEGRLVTITYITDREEASITDVMAIDLRDSVLMAELGFFVDDLFLCTIVTSDRHHELAKALQLIFGEGEWDDV